ncbi:MAG: MmgE/PrpD family protein [SAR202 cluster bacterium]|nr:MmgE/PrpD family protein [SAR202 cluster bacterium]
MPDSLSRTFARWSASLEYESLPPQVVDKLKASLLHSLVIALVGAETAPGKTAVELVRHEEAKADGATILGDGTRATRCGAAFANSKLMHATNQSDSYLMLVHPGPCIVPAGLATAELDGLGGQALLTALAAGYEAEARIAGDFIPSTQARGFRSSPVYGTLGAAVTTGKLLGLTEDQSVTALALACTFTGGTGEGPRSGGREMMFHEPQATRSGIMAALLARENMKGSELSLEGEAGLYNAFVGNNKGELSYVFAGPPHTSLQKVVAGLGSQWELMHVTPKIYPTAGYNCPVIELMTQLRASHDMPADQIQSITVDMNWLETTYPTPAFPNPARSRPGVASTHYFTAYTCIHGSYPPLRERIEPGERTSGEDPAVMDLLKRVEVIGHKDRPAFAPRITVRMRNGATYQGEFQGHELEWDLATETRRISELFDRMDWPRRKLEGIVEAVTHLEDAASLGPLVRLCVRG